MAKVARRGHWTGGRRLRGKHSACSEQEVFVDVVLACPRLDVIDDPRGPQVTPRADQNWPRFSSSAGNRRYQSWTRNASVTAALSSPTSGRLMNFSAQRRWSSSGTGTTGTQSSSDPGGRWPSLHTTPVRRLIWRWWPSGMADAKANHTGGRSGRKRVGAIVGAADRAGGESAWLVAIRASVRADTLRAPFSLREISTDPSACAWARAADNRSNPYEVQSWPSRRRTLPRYATSMLPVRRAVCRSWIVLTRVEMKELLSTEAS